MTHFVSVLQLNLLCDYIVLLHESSFSPTLFISWVVNPHFLPLFSVPGPCEPEDLINGIIFASNYLGSTQLLSDRNPSKSVRMKQAQEAVDCVKVLYKILHTKIFLLPW